MSDAHKATGLELRSLIRKSGELELSLAKVALPEPAADQVLVKVEATPINPSDLGLLLGPADMTTVKSTGSGDGTGPRSIAAVPGGAPRPGTACRQRRRGHGDRSRRIGGGAGAQRQDRFDDRRRDVRTVPPDQGSRLPAAAGRNDRGGRRVLVHQSADGARHDR